MKIFSWNVNGLRAVLKKNFYEFVADKAPDILCLQETKISLPDTVNLDLPFKYKYFYAAEKKGYSGTAIFTNREPFDVRNILLENHPEEGRIICADFGEFNLVTVYVPNSKSELERLKYRCENFDADFRKYLKNLANAKPLFVCGDLNVAHNDIDLKNPESNHFSAGFTDEERESFSKLLSAGFVDTWRSFNPQKEQYTWWSYRSAARERNVGWRIDYFLSSLKASALVKDAKIHDDVLGSDHCPVSIEI